ncbi:MAG: hypothetical protein MHPSP_000668 [Paramarteilia canceri]
MCKDKLKCAGTLEAILRHLANFQGLYPRPIITIIELISSIHNFELVHCNREGCLNVAESLFIRIFEILDNLHEYEEIIKFDKDGYDELDLFLKFLQKDSLIDL